jgi:hypothetical protein
MSTIMLAPAAVLTHDVGVAATPSRRRFTVAHKAANLRAAERCAAPGAIAALLRREGLHSSPLTTWSRAERKGHPSRRPPPRASA